MTSTASGDVDLGMPRRGGLDLVPVADSPQTAKEFASDQEVRWCPGCGDYAVLAAVKGCLPQLGIARENIVFISGIGCSSRFPYYLDTYGVHSIHGRAPTLATGLAVSRPDLSVFVVTGDGDALSIGGNHLIHTLRRNVNVTILLFNNRIYGLTKGQFSPTSERGTVTKSTPIGSVESPFDPVALALGAGATFIGRALDSDRKGLSAVIEAAARHRGASLVEIYQDCPIFNDGSFDVLRRPEDADGRVISVVHGEPILFGRDNAWAVVRDGFSLQVVEAASTPLEDVVVHDESDAQLCFALTHMAGTDLQYAVTGVLRQVSEPTYDDGVREQAAAAKDQDREDLFEFIAGAGAWSVEPN